MRAGHHVNAPLKKAISISDWFCSKHEHEMIVVWPGTRLPRTSRRLGRIARWPYCLKCLKELRDAENE